MKATNSRERQIRKKAIHILLANGMTHREIASALNISASTVSVYREKLRWEF